MGAAFFYHLTDGPAEELLPQLLKLAGKQGWRVEIRGRAARARRRTVLRMRLLRQTCKEQHPEERCETEPSKGKAMHRNNWPDYCAAAVVKEIS